MMAWSQIYWAPQMRNDVTSNHEAILAKNELARFGVKGKCLALGDRLTSYKLRRPTDMQSCNSYEQF